VKELVSDKYFAQEIKNRIGVQIDTSKIDKEIANYENKLREVDLNKARLEREIDNLPVETKYRERKLHDMTLRLDGLYDTIVELEEQIEDAKLRRSSIEMESITLDNIYKIMQNFNKLYDIMNDEEKKSLVSYLIKRIEIYPKEESKTSLRSIEFNFPIYRDGKEVRKLLWEKGSTVETCVLLSRRDINTVKIKMEIKSEDKVNKKPPYSRIKEYILETYNMKVMKVHMANIAQVKRELGFDTKKAYNRNTEEVATRPCSQEFEISLQEFEKFIGRFEYIFVKYHLAKTMTDGGIAVVVAGSEGLTPCRLHGYILRDKEWKRCPTNNAWSP